MTQLTHLENYLIKLNYENYDDWSTNFICFLTLLRLNNHLNPLSNFETQNEKWLQEETDLKALVMNYVEVDSFKKAITNDSTFADVWTKLKQLSQLDKFGLVKMLDDYTLDSSNFTNLVKSLENFENLNKLIIGQSIELGGPEYMVIKLTNFIKQMNLTEITDELTKNCLDYQQLKTRLIDEFKKNLTNDQLINDNQINNSIYFDKTIDQNSKNEINDNQNATDKSNDNQITIESANVDVEMESSKTFDCGISKTNEYQNTAIDFTDKIGPNAETNEIDDNQNAKTDENRNTKNGKANVDVKMQSSKTFDDCVEYKTNAFIIDPSKGSPQIVIHNSPKSSTEYVAKDVKIQDIRYMKQEDLEASLMNTIKEPRQPYQCNRGDHSRDRNSSRRRLNRKDRGNSLSGSRESFENGEAKTFASIELFKAIQREEINLCRDDLIDRIKIKKIGNDEQNLEEIRTLILKLIRESPEGNKASLNEIYEKIGLDKKESIDTVIKLLSSLHFIEEDKSFIKLVRKSDTLGDANLICNSTCDQLIDSKILKLEHSNTNLNDLKADDKNLIDTHTDKSTESSKFIILESVLDDVDLAILQVIRECDDAMNGMSIEEIFKKFSPIKEQYVRSRILNLCKEKFICETISNHFKSIY